MSNRQLHNLTPISNSIDSADLFVVVDKSELTTHAVPLGDLSDALDGTIFLSSSYALTSSFTTGHTPSASISLNAITSSYSENMSGSSVFAWSSSYAFSVNQCFTDFDLFEITASDDTLNIYTIPNAGGSITIKPRSPFANSYVLKPTSHSDIIGSRIISPTSGVISYLGLPARVYEFEVSKLDTSEKVLKFSTTITYNNTPTSRYSEFVYHSAGGAQFASGSYVTAHSASAATSSRFSLTLNTVVSSSIAAVAKNASGSGVFSISASMASASLFADRSGLSLTSSNGPLPGMILIYAGIRDSGSNAWYDCSGGSYSTAYVALSSSIGNKFTDGVVSNRTPKISSNANSGSGPYNKQVYLTSTALGHPTNNQISMSYGTGTIIGNYPEGTVNGTDMADRGRAFYYNIKR